MDGGARLIAGRERVFTLFFGCDLATREFLDAGKVLFRLAECCLRLIQLGLGAVERHLIRGGIDLEKKLPLRDLVALFEASLQQQATYQRTHLDVADTHDAAGILYRQWHLGCSARTTPTSGGGGVAVFRGQVLGDPGPAESGDIGARSERDHRRLNGNVSFFHQPAIVIRAGSTDYCRRSGQSSLLKHIRNLLSC